MCALEYGAVTEFVTEKYHAYKSILGMQIKATLLKGSRCVSWHPCTVSLQADTLNLILGCIGLHLDDLVIFLELHRLLLSIPAICLVHPASCLLSVSCWFPGKDDTAISANREAA